MRKRLRDGSMALESWWSSLGVGEHGLVELMGGRRLGRAMGTRTGLIGLTGGRRLGRAGDGYGFDWAHRGPSCQFAQVHVAEELQVWQHVQAGLVAARVVEYKLQHRPQLWNE